MIRQTTVQLNLLIDEMTLLIVQQSETPTYQTKIAKSN